MFIRYRLLCINWFSLVVDDGNIFKGHSKFKITTVFLGMKDVLFVITSHFLPDQALSVGGPSITLFRYAEMQDDV